ncbi:MAG: lytic murein transglycosylase, partial [Alphaproteobacteria bacterium]|nr:lytic murein transglycosylase [Alphaproteobacteria bacterium]
KDGSPITSSMNTSFGLVADTKLLAKQDLKRQQIESQNITAQPTVIVAYLTYPNFYRIKKWNNSNWYAIAISQLSTILKQ